MKRKLALGAGAALLLLGACGPRIPDSGAGVGFDNYASYEMERARREAMLTGPAPSVAPAPAFAPAQAAGGISSADLAAAGIGAVPVSSAPIGVASPAGSTAPASFPSTVPGSGTEGLRTGVEASPGNAAPVLVGVRGSDGRISDEQDFDAVASRESIESDAARRAAQAAQYQVVQPTALPPPPQDTGPNIVEYALNAPNVRGQAIYSRFIFAREGRMLRNCAQYRSPDEAQRDFLARGGPQRDPLGLDPDGDGFACAWDPAPFRAAVGRS